MIIVARPRLNSNWLSRWKPYPLSSLLSKYYASQWLTIVAVGTFHIPTWQLNIILVFVAASWRRNYSQRADYQKRAPGGRTWTSTGRGNGRRHGTVGARRPRRGRYGDLALRACMAATRRSSPAAAAPNTDAPSIPMCSSKILRYSRNRIRAHRPGSEEMCPYPVFL